VHQWSAASYLEDQDQWWLPGIFRSVTLLARPTAAIDDVFVRAGWTSTIGGAATAGTAASGRPETGTGTITFPTLDAVFPVRFRVPDLGVDVTWASADEVAPITLEGVEPWSAEVPKLYDPTPAAARAVRRSRCGSASARCRSRATASWSTASAWCSTA